MAAHVFTAPVGTAGRKPGGSEGKDAKHIVLTALKGVAGFFDKLRRASDAAAQYDYLSRLSDHELRNRSLERSDIARVVYQKYFGDAA